MFLDSLPYAVVVHHCKGLLSAGSDQASSDGWVAGVVAGCLLAAVVVSAWWYRHHPPDDSDGGGGSGGPPPEPPPPEPPPSDGPSWWPEFEREFAAYVAGEAENVERRTRISALRTDDGPHERAKPDDSAAEARRSPAGEEDE